MYIEFTLPQGAGGMAAGHTLRLIKLSLEEWCDKYQITCQQKTEKYRHRITFNDDEYYTLFSLTWNPERKSYLGRWRIVSDLNNKI
jgi:hypothetical protein